MAQTLKHRIIEFLTDDQTKFYSISDIAKKLGVAYSHAHSFVNKLAVEGVIEIHKIGNVSVCRPNPKSNLMTAYLTLTEARKTEDWLKKNPHAEKIIERINTVKDHVHCVLIKNNKVIIIVPEMITGVDFSIFRNRSVMNRKHFAKNKEYYKDCIVLHGAEKFWGIMGET